MDFEDLIGLIIFLAIVAFTTIFRVIKEGIEARKEQEQPKRTLFPPSGQLKPESERTSIPRRKIIIRTENVEVPKTPLEEEDEKKEKPSRVIRESQYIEEGKSLEESARSLEDSYEEEGIPSDKKKITTLYTVREKVEKIQEVPQKVQKRKSEKLPPLVKPLYKRGITFTAPMERKTFASAYSTPMSRDIVVGTVGGVPQLQWAIIMMELLGPPKSLRDDI